MSKISYVRERDTTITSSINRGRNYKMAEGKFIFRLGSIHFLLLLSFYFIFILLKDFIPWVYGAHWTTGSIRECYDINPDVACFSVLTARWKQLLFGLYPAEEYWRPILTFLSSYFINQYQYFSLDLLDFSGFPLFIRALAIWLLWGGSFWSVAIIYIGLGFGFLSFIFLNQKNN